MSPDSLEYLEPEYLGGLNLYSYCGNNPVMRDDPNGTEWWHWLIGGLVVVALIAATFISAGSFAGGMIALGYAVNGIASASLATTVFSFAAVGAGTLYAASAIVAGIYTVETWCNGGSFLDGVNTFMGYGETAMWSTLSGGLMGGIGGYASFREQIGNSSQAGFMTKKQRIAQRRALMKTDTKNLAGKQISHIYGTYGNNRNYYKYQTPAEHRAFHAQYGYKTNGGPFNRVNPFYHNWWLVLKMIFGL